MHSHNHSHSHEHSHGVSNISTAFFIALILNVWFVALELFYGFHINSLALLSDAWHNTMDILNLILSGVALWIGKFSATKKYTYGYKRWSILSALLNSILLIFTACFILYEAIIRIYHPVTIEWVTMMIIAGIGIFVNGISGLILMNWGKEDINIKSAYLHMLGDAWVSLGVVIAGGLILLTGYTIIDPIISIIVSIIMIWSVIWILRESFRMSFDGMPSSLDREDIEQCILDTAGVISFHHLHIWPLSTTENALTVHILIESEFDMVQVKKEIRHLLEHENIHHSTIEIEYHPCWKENC